MLLCAAPELENPNSRLHVSYGRRACLQRIMITHTLTTRNK